MIRGPARRWHDAPPFFLQAVIFGFALASASRTAWIAAFCLGAALNLWGWQRAFGKRRHILDTPTSRIAAAAQGDVELIGVGRPLAETQLLTPHSRLPCLWYRYTVERRENERWRQVDTGESDLPFLLDDGSGHCELDPHGAEILTSHHETRSEGDTRIHESLLLEGDRLYALGHFASVNGAQARLDQRLDVADLLADWKRDQPELRQRFDLDGNGEIEAHEWALARLAAEREIARQHQAIRARPMTHTLSQPDAGRPYLISNRPPRHLGRRYAWLAALHLALFAGMLAGIGWAAQQTF